MPMPAALRHLRAVDPVPVVHELAVTGRISDALSGAGLEADLALSWRVRGSDTAFRAFPGWLKRLGDGRFAIALGVSQLPPVDPGDSVDLRLEVALPFRAAEVRTVELPGAAFAPVSNSADTRGGTVSWEGLAAPLHVFDVAIAPRPVTLEGTVLLDHDPGTPAAGTVITILDPADAATATADARGAFRLPLPVAVAVSLRLEHPDASAEITIRPDFAARINRLPFNLDT